MRTKHDSDAAFDEWVDGAEQLRTHSVQAAFRQGWNKGGEKASLSCPHTTTIERLKEALRLVYGYAAAIQRMSVFAPIGFRCSLIRETVSRALPDGEAKRLHDETEIILDALTAE
jgi:hypothetical protein